MSEGGAESKAHCINTDANHTGIKCNQLFFWQIFFILMVTIEYAFVFKDFLLLHKLKKGRQPHLCQLLTYTSPISTLLETNQMLLDFGLTN